MYKLTFEDGTNFIDKEHITEKWKEIPDKSIRKIEYTLFGKTILLEGYDLYNHLVEKPTGIAQSVLPIVKIILLASKNGKVKRFTFDIIKCHLKVDEVQFGKEHKERPSSGWKRGLFNQTPTYKII
jgi:hypothetical protein